MRAVLKREFRSLFSGARGYIAAALLLLASGSLVIYYGFLLNVGSITYILSDVMLVCAIVCPILCFGIFESGDKQLFSLPISSLDAILGKYFAVLSLYAMQSVFFVLITLIYNYFGEIEFTASFVSILIYFLFAAAISAVNLLFFSVIKKPAFSVAASIGFVALMYVLQIIDLLVSKVAVLGEMISFIGIFNRFESLIYGKLEISSVIYYLSIILFCLFLSVRRFENRREEETA